MKKLMTNVNFAIIAGVLFMAPAMAATGGADQALCLLAEKFGDIFEIIRTLAFVGAGVTIAGWAWGYISAGKIEAVKEAKEKGIALLIGFILLFGVGTVLEIFIALTGENGVLDCVPQFFGN